MRIYATTISAIRTFTGNKLFKFPTFSLFRVYMIESVQESYKQVNRQKAQDNQVRDITRIGSSVRVFLYNDTEKQ